MQASKLALPERALLMLQQMFLQIRQDLDPAEQIRVNVDLTGPTKAKRGQKQKLPAGAFLAREQLCIYRPVVLRAVSTARWLPADAATGGSGDGGAADEAELAREDEGEGPV